MYTYKIIINSTLIVSGKTCTIVTVIKFSFGTATVSEVYFSEESLDWSIISDVV